MANRSARMRRWRHGKHTTRRSRIDRDLEQRRRQESAFLVELLEPRQMLTIDFTPLPSVVHTSPCDPVVMSNSWYDRGGSPFSGAQGSASSISATAVSPSGVRYFDGMVSATQILIESNGFGRTYSMATTWSPYANLANGSLGTRISNPSIPELRATSDEAPFSYLIANGATDPLPEN